MKSTLILSLLHLVVDGLCACCVYMLTASIGTELAFGMFLAYNALAFLTQPLTGHVLDAGRHGWRFLCIGVCLLELGGLLTFVSSVLSFVTPRLACLAILMVGLGNSLFHVFGGKTVAVSTHNDVRHLGVFVSTGALGLLLGQEFAGSHGTLLILMAFMAILCLAFRTRFALRTESVTPSPLVRSGISASLMLFMMLLVFIRSFMGQMAAPDTALPLVAVLMVVLTFLGKSTGGLVACRLGIWRTLCGTLLMACVFFLSSGWHVVFCLALVLAVNLTMPLTLHLANRSLPGREGLAFGLLAASLIPGFALGSYCVQSVVAWQLTYPLTATILIEALVLLFIRERRWTVLAMSLVMNILTNVPLNLLALSLPALQTSLPLQFGAEFVVVVLETTLYFVVLHNARQALSYAILCNAVSYLCGILYTIGNF